MQIVMSIAIFVMKEREKRELERRVIGRDEEGEQSGTNNIQKKGE